MLAADTNLVVRILTNDSPAEAKRANTLFASNDMLIPKTVLLEAEWVLRFSYGLDREGILRGFHGLLGLPNVTAEDEWHVADALRWYEEGLDFGDALHLASSSKAELFATFDKELAKRARTLSAPQVKLI